MNSENKKDIDKKKKCILLLRLRELEQRGIHLTKRYDMNSSLDEMTYECEYHACVQRKKTEENLIAKSSRALSHVVKEYGGGLPDYEKLNTNNHDPSDEEKHREYLIFNLDAIGIRVDHLQLNLEQIKDLYDKHREEINFVKTASLFESLGNFLLNNNSQYRQNLPAYNSE